MKRNPTYEELINRVAELESEAANSRSAEDSLKKSNEIVSSILSASPIGIGLVENRIIKRINEAMKKMFRFESETDYLGKSARIIYPSDEDFQKVGEFIYNQFKAGREAVLDTTFKRRDGSTFFGHIKVNTMNPPDPMKRATFTISDISWRKQAEAEMLQREKLQAVVEMAGAVCHEMNQPMQVALVELAECMAMEGFKNNTIKQKAENIRQQLNALRQLSRKLMHITRYETRDYVKGEKIIDIDKSSGTMG
ncbi:MAG: PAS domain S-box protein [Desulfobacterales bacterium]|nr:MAG: PAS domain S-box protein [Desulfobacterales bacterium]